MLAALRNKLRSTSTLDAPTAPGLDVDDVFEVISNQRRRLVIHYLARDVPDASIRDLAGYIATVECDVPVEDLESHERKRVYIGLYQTHLSKLADADIIEYDERDGIASATPATRAVAGAIDHVETTVAGGDA